MTLSSVNLDIKLSSFSKAFFVVLGASDLSFFTATSDDLLLSSSDSLKFSSFALRPTVSE